jgi:hypothetical protein
LDMAGGEKEKNRREEEKKKGKFRSITTTE